MRTLSATQLAKQSAANRVPYIKVIFTDGTTSYDYTTRWLRIYHDEAPYGGKGQSGSLNAGHSCFIELNNSDGLVASLTTDFYLDIEYGDVTSAGNESVEYPRMFVRAQVAYSAPGIKKSYVFLDDSFLQLSEQPVDYVGNPPSFSYTYTATTPYNIISAALTAEGYTLDALATSDGIIDVFTPTFEINKQPWEDVLNIIYRAVMTSKSYIRAVENKHFEIIYPQETDTIGETYYTVQADGTPVAYNYLSRTNKQVPNHVIVYCNQATDGTWDNLIIGSSFVDNGDIPIYTKAANITTQLNADNYATAILTRLRAEEKSSSFTCPHDAQLELNDYVTVSDGR